MYAHVSEDHTIPSFSYGDGTQIFGLGGKDLYLLSHLTLSISFPFLKDTVSLYPAEAGLKLGILLPTPPEF